MEDKRKKLINTLRVDSRQKLSTISKHTKIPISTLFDYLKDLQKDIIQKSTILLDFAKLGLHTRAQIFLKVNLEDKEKIKSHLSFNACINNLYRINNGWDFILETIHGNVKELDQFLESLSCKFRIEKQEIHYLIEDIKREGFEI
jgi:DNA-binding Lrp family transcriptional regulator